MHSEYRRISAFIYNIPVNDIPVHSPWKVSYRTEGLLICEVAPATYPLTEHEVRYSEISQVQERYFLLLCIQPCHKQSTDNTAVNSQTSVPDPENRCQVILVLIPAENHIIEPRKNDGYRRCKKNEIQDVVRCQIILPAAS